MTSFGEDVPTCPWPLKYLLKWWVPESWRAYLPTHPTPEHKCQKMPVTPRAATVLGSPGSGLRSGPWRSSCTRSELRPRARNCSTSSSSGAPGKGSWDLLSPHRWRWWSLQVWRLQVERLWTWKCGKPNQRFGQALVAERVPEEIRPTQQNTYSRLHSLAERSQSN